MEYFDPKTRPQSIFIDDDALLSAPKDLIRSTATTVFASLVGAMSQTDLNALAQGDQQTAYGLAYPAYMHLMDELDNPQLQSRPRHGGLFAEPGGRRWPTPFHHECLRWELRGLDGAPPALSERRAGQIDFRGACVFHALGGNPGYQAGSRRRESA